MKDHFNRNINSLRISVTQRCNLDCWYCHREGEQNPGYEITLEKIKEIVKFMAGKGIKYAKITGGEPLIRSDIVDIVSAISGTKGITEVSMTTNGFLLSELAKPLKEAGLSRVNIGCDSTFPSVSYKNTQNILPGLKAAKKAGLDPIKLNMVLLKGINDHEVWDLVKFAGANKVILQLIELIPMSQNEYFRKHYLSLDKIEEKLEADAHMIVKRNMHGRRQFHVRGAVIEIVKPHETDFCRSCTRIRVTSDGRIKSCLRTEDAIPITDSIEEAFNQALGKRVIYCENLNG